MKKITTAILAIASIIMAAAFTLPQNAINGAWSIQEGSNTRILVIHDGYLAHTTFDKAGKKFIETRGGVTNVAGNKLSLQYEFNSADKDVVGTSVEYTFNIDKGNLVLTQGSAKETWKRIDDNKGALAGVWYISGRLNNGQIAPRAFGPRKTLKILSGTRFQWVQVNLESKEAGATGGGTYTFANGKYIETIEFFSRDSSRVGATLSFDDSVNGNVWTHKGQSSTGQAMHEEWTRHPVK